MCVCVVSILDISWYQCQLSSIYCFHWLIFVCFSRVVFGHHVNSGLVKQCEWRALNWWWALIFATTVSVLSTQCTVHSTQCFSSVMYAHIKSYTLHNCNPTVELAQKFDGGKLWWIWQMASASFKCFPNLSWSFSTINLLKLCSLNLFCRAHSSKFYPFKLSLYKEVIVINWVLYMNVFCKLAFV